jgi:hypothetical protein
MYSMRSAYATASVAIASFLAATLGLDAVRVLGSPFYGIEELRRSEPLFAIGRLLGLDARGLIAVAAGVGAFELATAAVLLVYVIERLAGDGLDRATRQTLDAALILVTIHTAGALAFSLPRLAAGPIRLSVINLALVGIAALLATIERGGTDAGEAPRRPVTGWHDPSADGWFAA